MKKLTENLECKWNEYVSKRSASIYHDAVEAAEDPDALWQSIGSKHRAQLNSKYNSNYVTI